MVRMKRGVLLMLKMLLLLVLAVPLPGMASLASHDGKGAEQSHAPMSLENRANRPARVMVELSGEPAAPLFARARDAAVSLGSSRRAHAVQQATIEARAQLA